MFKNNNEAAVRRISSRSMRHNRARNIFAVLAIILTTFMFTAVFSIGFSLGKNMSIMLIRQQGTKSSVFLENPTDVQIAQAKKAAHLNAAGVQIHAGEISAENEDDLSVTVDYFDETEFNENYVPAISDINGSYPVKENEIMLSRSAMEVLGVKSPEKGMNIHLRLKDGTKQKFVLSGWFRDYENFSSGYQALVSKEYTDSQGLSAEKNGRLSLSAKSGSQSKLLEELEQNVSLNGGQEFKASFDVQEESGSNTLIIAVMIGLIGVIIVISGYLLIYNVMYISVTKDIRFYGMLKTIGTSPSQIKKVVKMQAFRLSAIGIPVGVLLGTVISFAAVPYALEMFSGGIYDEGAMPADISFNPLIYVATIVFGIVTVAISCRKPAKLAAKVSPVEALKYNGAADRVKKKSRKTTGSAKLYRMSFINVFREKKRAFLVFASLFMGTMAFLSVNAFTRSMDLENYVRFYLPNDFKIYCHSDDDSAAEAEARLAEKISQINGITMLETNRSTSADLQFDRELYKPFIDKDRETVDESMISAMLEQYESGEVKYSAPVIGVSSRMIKEYNSKARDKIDIEKFEKGEAALIGKVRNDGDGDGLLGKTITLTDSETGRTADVEIGSVASHNSDYGLNIGYYWANLAAPSCIIVSQDVIDKLTDKADIDTIIADCDQNAQSSAAAQIKSLTDNNPVVVSTEIKSEMISDFKTSMTSLNVLTSGISVILILIGIINFINVMLTGVFTRRKELAVLESVGMTKKQVRKMLMLEGVYYGVITIALIMTAGSGIMYLVGRLAEKVADYAVFSFPWTLIAAIAVVIMLICVAVPALVYRSISKSSITERLRIED
ncbi:ABC transporter permease [Ruminococcus sp. Marseille-P6503]|uniref:ABC transporter permease n=1 Tax=Ruminococcus sp. Marseille-P6503 TaxID=2364796 RepID=UPI000F5323DF|nr:ABC transporter permease [Ruminococcus sp. Marseille-P6503]